MEFKIISFHLLKFYALRSINIATTMNVKLAIFIFLFDDGNYID